jgi:hypothetical protein
MKIAYITKRFRQKSLDTIATANQIINSYRARGFDLTLRQLYYQFVAKDLIPNTERSYNNLGSIISDGRLTGLVDWDAIEDRTRNVRMNAHWRDPGGVIDSAADSFALDKWRGQKYAPEIWIEKDALIGVIEGICRQLDIPFFSCRGYVSQSEMWRGGRRLLRNINNSRTPIIFHLGDHDPSGMDMTRDIRDRLTMFAERGVRVERIALNMDQIQEHQPPPNPAKVTDSRAEEYIAEYGNESWELDALPPEVLSQLVEEAVEDVIDQAKWDSVYEEQEEGRKLLRITSQNWSAVAEFVGDNFELEEEADDDDDEDFDNMDMCGNCGESCESDEIQKCDKCGMDGLGNCCIGEDDHDCDPEENPTDGD